VRNVLLDVGAESGWIAELGDRAVIRLQAGEWSAAETWVEEWAVSAGARIASGDWASRKLGMTREAVFEISTSLHADFTARLAGGGELAGDAATVQLCAEVLGWTAKAHREPAESWRAFAEIAPAAQQPAFLIDARGDPAAALEQGDMLAGCGLQVGLRVAREAWDRFLAGEDWSRCATRWRNARALRRSPAERSAIPTEAARNFIHASAPDTLPLLERAGALLAHDQAAAAGALSSQARSAAEAFLFAVLDARPFTHARFALNAPLAFDFGLRAAEADLAAADARLVVELDGYYHFRDAAAYRRDRRKDALLQEHGWFVLRFLAEDVVSDPGAVVSQIERTLARRGAPQSIPAT
jgi:very-short-patch-repair endonuclease